MSYILKALRKSEAERAKGEVPRLTTRHDSEPARRARLWPALAAGALLVNLGVAALVLWQPGLLPAGSGVDDPGTGEQVQTGPVPTAEPAAPAATLSQLASLDDSEATRPAEAEASLDQTAATEAPVAPPVLEPAAAPLADPAPVADPEPVAKAVAEPQPLAVAPPTVVEEGGVEAAAVPEAPPPAVEVEEVVREVPPRPKAKPTLAARQAERVSEDSARHDPPALQPARDQLAWAVAEPEIPAAPPPPEPLDPFAEVPELWRMSPAFRQSVPDMTISVHVYSSEERSRFVIIDRHKYWEGDRLDGGILVEAILPRGVVFQLNGQQFKLISG